MQLNKISSPCWSGISANKRYDIDESVVQAIRHFINWEPALCRVLCSVLCMHAKGADPPPCVYPPYHAPLDDTHRDTSQEPQKAGSFPNTPSLPSLFVHRSIGGLAKWYAPTLRPRSLDVLSCMQKCGEYDSLFSLHVLNVGLSAVKANEEGWDHRQVRYTLWCILA